MKVQGAKKIHYDSGPNMTPLVDIVMIILIFLMLAGRFGGDEHYLVSKIPTRQRGGGPVGRSGPLPPDDPLMEIRVDTAPVAQGTSPDGFVATLGGVPTGDAEQLTERIRQMRTWMNDAGTPDDKVWIVIEPGKLVQHRSLMRVYEAAMRAGFTRIAFGSSH